MTAVPLPEHDIRPLLGGRLSLAAINGPSRCVVAGPFDAVEALERKLAERGIDCRRLHTSHAFHSAMLDPIVEPFAELVQQVPLSAPAIPFVSNVTGTWITAEEQATWLIFGDTCGLGALLARQLEQEGRTVVVITAGEQWRRLDERAYSIRPAERDDYEALIEELRATSTLPQAIVHLWNVTPPEPAAQGHDLSFYSLLFLVQALGALSHPISLAVVSNNMHSVAGEAALEPEKALLLGPCKVIPREYPNVVCRSINIILPAYAQLSQGRPIELPAATVTFRGWAQQLAAYAESGMLESELDYWIDEVRAQTAPLPADEPDAGTDVAVAPHTFTVTPSPEQTSALLHELPSSYHAGVEAVLLAPLAQALASWAEAPALLLDLEAGGRAGPLAQSQLDKIMTGIKRRAAQQTGLDTTL